MSTNTAKLAMALISTLFIVSCGGGGGTDDGTQAEVRKKNDRLRDVYAKVEGVYQGDLQVRGSQTRSLQVQIVVYTDRLPDGVDENGAPKTRLVLKSQFRILNAVGELDDQMLDVNYDSYSGEVSMTLPNNGFTALTACPVGPKDPDFALLGRFQNGKLSSQVLRTGGIWGELQAQRVDEENRQPIFDQYQRLLDAYLPVQGTYRGTYSSQRESFPFEINLVVTDIIVGEGGRQISCPGLRGQYIRPDLGGGIGLLSLVANYYHWDSRIVITSIITGGGLPGSKDLTISGYWNPEGIEGDFSWFGRFGRVKAKRLSGRINR